MRARDKSQWRNARRGKTGRQPRMTLSSGSREMAVAFRDAFKSQMRIREIPIPFRRLAALALITTALSCGGASSTGTIQPSVSLVIVNAPKSIVVLGRTLQLTAVAVGENGLLVTGVTYQWSSSNSSKATVSGTGVVTGVALGSATISATTGTVTGSIDVAVDTSDTIRLTRVQTPRG